MEPENAKADFKVINDLLCSLHRKSRELIPEAQLQPVISWNRTQPPGYGQLCGCTTQLISGSCYQEMIAPLDDQLLAVYADYLYRKRATGVPKPDMLKDAIRNRQVRNALVSPQEGADAGA